MPPKPLEELTAVEISLLGIAARLQVAVKWVERHPPLPDKWAYLNTKVKAEIVSIKIVHCHIGI
jgi:predicted nicotinamide N-methyase